MPRARFASTPLRRLRLALPLTLALASFGAVTARTTDARADMSESERKANARTLFFEGTKLQDAGKYQEALEKLEAAQRLYDAPTHLLHVAECQALTGKLVEAAETYRQLARTRLAPGAPEAFVQAQQQGAAELPPLEARIPKLAVSTQPEARQLKNLEVRLNNEPMPVELVGVSRGVNPGKYTLTASAEGYREQKPEEIEVKERENRTVVVQMVADASAHGAVAGAAGAAGTEPGTTPTTPPSTMKPQPKQGTDVGLILGVGPGLYFPTGDAAHNVPMKRVAGFGPGVEGRIGLRLSLFYMGLSLDYAYLGSKAAGAADGKLSTSTLGVQLFAGLQTSPKKVAFIAEFGTGIRSFSTSNDRGTSITGGGLQFSAAAGVAVPVGPLKIVPKVGYYVGVIGSSTPLTCATGSDSALCGGLSNLQIDSFTGVGSSGLTTFGMGLLQLNVWFPIDFRKDPPKEAAN